MEILMIEPRTLPFQPCIPEEESHSVLGFAILKRGPADVPLSPDTF